MTSSFSLPARLGAFAILLVGTLLTGCAALAWVGHVVTGDSAVAARYQLPKKKTILVLVDDPQNLLGGDRLTYVAEAQANFVLKQDDAKRKLVPVAALSNLAMELDGKYPTTPITTLGRKLGADVVIYAQVANITLQSAYNVYRPIAQVNVKVIDVKQRQRLFPRPGPLSADTNHEVTGYPLIVKLPHETVDLSQPEVNSLALRKLARQIGVEIAQLFFAHPEKTPQQSSLGDD